MLYVIIICSLCGAAIAIAVQIIKKKRLTKRDAQRRHNTGRFLHTHLNYQHEKKMIQRMLPALQSRSGLNTANPARGENKILNNRNDISHSLLLLIREYSLDICTIATSDGLVVATTGDKQAQNDAATYGRIKPPYQIPNNSGIIVFNISLKGSELVGIVRTRTLVSEDISKKIAADTQAILNKLI